MFGYALLFQLVKLK